MEMGKMICEEVDNKPKMLYIIDFYTTWGCDKVLYFL